MAHVVITPELLDEAAVRDAVADPKAGAIVSFVGAARDHHDGKVVVRLEYEAFAEMAIQQLEKLQAEAVEKFDVVDVAVHHRTGRTEIGEASVIIAVSAAHRGAAFDACRYVIDTLKETVPIWKKEFYADGSAWIGAQGKRLEPASE